MLIHCKNCCTNAPQRYVRSLPVLLYVIIQSTQPPPHFSFCWAIICMILVYKGENIYIYIYIYIYYYTRQKRTWISQCTIYVCYRYAICCIPLYSIVSDLCTVVILTTTRQAMEDNVTLRRFHERIFCNGKVLEFTYSEILSAALGSEHKMRKRNIFICGLPVSTAFFHIFSQTVRFS